MHDVRTSGLIVLMLMACGAVGLQAMTASPTWAQASAAPFDDAEAQLRIRQASLAASAAAREVDSLRKELEVERRRVVQTESERDLNQAILKGLEKDLRVAEATQQDADTALKAAQAARARGLPADRQPEAAPTQAVQSAAYEEASRQCFEGKGDDLLEGCDIVILSNREPPRRMATALVLRGLEYSSKGQYDRAIENYDRALKLRAEYFFAFYARGLSYFYKGLYDRAVQDEDEAIRQQPDYAASFSTRGNAYLNLGRYDRALQDYDKTVQLEPDNSKRWYDRCLAKALAGRSKDALPDCDQALRLKPDDGRFLASRALVLWQLGRSGEAEAGSRAAVAKAPKSAWRHYLLNLVLAAKGDAAGSRAEIDEARQLSSPVEFERIQRDLARFRRN